MRDTNPEKFYPAKNGVVQKFDDLPKKYWDNINTEAPFDRKKGDKAALNEAEIKDVVTFLRHAHRRQVATSQAMKQ